MIEEFWIKITKGVFLVAGNLKVIIKLKVEYEVNIVRNIIFIYNLPYIGL